MKLLLEISFMICIQICVCERRFPNFYPELKTKKIVGDAGEPLFLTPLIQQNRIQEAQAAATVDNSVFNFQGVRSYSGYLTVDSNYNSNLFFWFFPAFEDYDNAPVVLWLQGGPGATSLFGLFEENGPFVPNGNLQLSIRNTTWASSYSVIYIDNPVGTGFSFTNGGYAHDQTKVGADLYEALQQFFTLFPELRVKEFFITGESYAGKYIPAIAYTILQRNPSAAQQINLQGLCIGNGLSDPKYQLIYGNRLYELGLIDLKTRDQFLNLESQVSASIDQSNYDAANELISQMINGGPNSLFGKSTGFFNVHNFLLNDDSASGIQNHYLSELVNNDDFRRSIHVGSTDFGDPRVSEYLSQDIPKSVAPWIAELLNNYRILIYNGQLDILVPYPSTTTFLSNLEFDGAQEYQNAQRQIWTYNNDIAGYVKKGGNLVDVLVRNAGHMVPADQPLWALEMLTKFIKNQNLHD